MQTAPRTIERDNQNTLRKYPFADAASCGSGDTVIPCGAIIDAQLYIPGRTPGEVWLSEVDAYGLLRFADVDGEFAVTVARPQAHTAVPVRFTGTGGPLPGGVVVFGQEAEVAALTALAGTAFTADETALAAAAVTFTGLGGVSGFLLDDGHVVSGDVKFKGANGCDVATFVGADGTQYLRISAVGALQNQVETTGFITRVVAESDNTDFIVANRPTGLENRVIDILLNGAREIQSEDVGLDQDDACAQVKKAAGNGPDPRAVPAKDCVCQTGTPVVRTLTFYVEDRLIRTLTLLDGADLGSVPPPKIAAEGLRFSGYFDAETGGKLYYRFDGTGVGKLTVGHDVTLYAHVIAATSRAEVSFDGYGTLHLNAPSTPDYNNPIRITGDDGVPVVKETGSLVGGSNALADVVLHPDVPSGSVTLSLRGFNKVAAS